MQKIQSYALLVIGVLFLFQCKDKENPPPAPVISSFSPASGTVGTTVTITGSNFSTTTANNIVKFNGTKATITAATATSLTTSVPTGATTGKITVETGGQTATSSTDFTIEVPVVITSFAPASGAVGSTVTITGSGFSSNAASNSVFINNFVATVTAATATSLTITVPTQATIGKVSVRVGNQTATSANDFTVLLPPTFTFFEPFSGPVGSILKINGTNFSTVAANNIVKLGGLTLTPVSATPTLLEVRIPAGATSGAVTVESNGFPAVTVQRLFVVHGDLVAKANFAGNGRTLAVSFAIGNKGYVGTGTTTGNNSGALQDFWEYDPATNVWTQKANFAGGSRFRASGFGLEGKGYIGLGFNTSVVPQKDFWEYDPTANTWTRKADFGGAARFSATAFTIGNLGYVGLGSVNLTTKTDDFWSFNPTANTWTQRSNFPGGLRDQAFGVGVVSSGPFLGGYVGAGANATNFATNDMWIYNAATNTWAAGLSGFGGSTTFSAITYSIDSVIYFVTLAGSPSTNSWQYNILTREWVSQAGIPARSLGVGFAINGKGYVGMGTSQNGSGNLNDFYEFTPR